jgi:hypothetical protein
VMKMNLHPCFGETVLILLEEREWVKMCLCDVARNDCFWPCIGELAPFIGCHVALVANGLLTCVPGLALIRNWTFCLEGPICNSLKLRDQSAIETNGLKKDLTLIGTILQ